MYVTKNVAYCGGPGSGWFQLMNNGGSGRLEFRPTDDCGPTLVSSRVLALNTWYHVAGVYNATARTLDIYVNGALNNGTLAGTVPASQFNPTVNVNLGRRADGFYFIGTIDEIRVYNRALSQAEIQADMNTPVGSTADTQAPTAPTAVAAAAASSTQINLTWTAATDNVGVTGYLVERCQGSVVFPGLVLQTS